MVQENFTSKAKEDQLLVNAIKLRSRSAFNDLYDRYAPTFYGTIKKTLFREDVSSEILKNSFVKLWNSIDEFDPSKERFFTWALRIVRKEIRMQKISLLLQHIFYCQQPNSLKKTIT